MSSNNKIARALQYTLLFCLYPSLNLKDMFYFFKGHLKENMLLKTSASTVICFSGPMMANVMNNLKAQFAIWMLYQLFALLLSIAVY